MSRRIPGREPALVGSAQLRSGPGQARARPAAPATAASVAAPPVAAPPVAAPPVAVRSTMLTSVRPAAESAAHLTADLTPDLTLDLAAGARAASAVVSVARTPPRPAPVTHRGGVQCDTDVLPGASAANDASPSSSFPSGPPPDEIDELWAAYLDTPARTVRDRLVVHYTPLVRAVAHRIAAGLPPYVEHADLVQSGVFGLIDAVMRFDPERCPRFESYAAQRIRGAILDELRAQDWVPRSVRGRARELERAQERLEGRLLRGATDRELAAELGVTVRDLAGLTRQVQLVSVEALHESTGGVAELLADTDAPDPVAVVQDRETLRQLSVAVGQLGERDQTVIRLYYLENRTLAEIGSLLGVTESRVCQLHTRLVGRLRGRLEELAAG